MGDVHNALERKVIQRSQELGGHCSMAVDRSEYSRAK